MILLLKKNLNQYNIIINSSKNVRFVQTVSLLTLITNQKHVKLYPKIADKKAIYNSLLLFLKERKKTQTISPKFLQKFLNKKQRFSLESKKKYLIIRIFVSFTNLNFSLTNLTGKILSWCSGGSIENQTRRTRLTSRSIGILLSQFMTPVNFKTSNFKQNNQTKYLKVVFCGPSKRFRGKIFSIIKKRAKKLNIRVLCKEEAFRKSLGGCKLKRSKR